MRQDLLTVGPTLPTSFEDRTTFAKKSSCSPSKTINSLCPHTEKYPVIRPLSSDRQNYKMADEPLEGRIVVRTDGWIMDRVRIVIVISLNVIAGSRKDKMKAFI